ncbi:MerR family DNA-binding transcriptional regulator [Paenibacillus xylanexedens]|nr:MerR family DNA-binding transcriptional regulator [Paenibacillus xylanexedens]
MFSISEIEKITGLRPSTLRYYEQEGILPNVEMIYPVFHPM